MKIHHSLKTFKANRPVITMGVFDGVHPGHVALLMRTVVLAKATQKESAVLTFQPHPRVVLNQEPEKLRLLTSLEEKLKIISESGIDNVIVLPFTAELASLSAEKFIEEILVKELDISYLTVGYNHRFGKGGITFEDLELLARKYNFGLSKISQVEKDNQAPSSTQIRNYLLNGDIKQANKMLGYRYIISGKVKEGNQIGRKLSYPTANLEIDDPMKQIPPNGVYACHVKTADDLFEGMVNIGFRPTVNKNNKERSIEVHILDFEGDIYSEKIELNLVDRMRDEIEFADTDELRKQLKKDKKNARDIIKSELIDTFAKIFSNNFIHKK